MRCGQRKHSFWDDPVGDLLTYLCKPRPWANKIFALAQNAKAFELHFIQNWAILLKCKPELIMSGLKIMCIKMEHLDFWTACPSFHVLCVNCPKHLDCQLPSHGTRIILIPGKPKLCRTPPRHGVLWSGRDA